MNGETGAGPRVKIIKAIKIRKETSSGISHHFFSWRKNRRSSFQIILTIQRTNRTAELARLFGAGEHEWVQDKKVTGIKVVYASSCLSHVGEEFPLLPKAVENAIHDGATDGQDVIGAADGPEHA